MTRTGATAADEAAYFANQRASNDEFWRRFGKRPEFAGKLVVDVGCGHGALTQEVAQAGGQVLGIDVDEKLIEFATCHVTDPGAEFRAADLVDLGICERFDIALSKDTFEHVGNLRSMLAALYRALKPGGELWAGFSPLYYSPFGDHRRTGLKVPWAHAVLPTRVVLRAAQSRHGHAVNSLGDLGLNGLTPREFRRDIKAAGFEVVSMEFNRGDKPMLRALDQLRRVPAFERFATVGIYTILRRPIG